MMKLTNLLILLLNACFFCVFSAKLFAEDIAVTTYERQQIGQIWMRNFHLQQDSLFDPIAEDFALRLLNDLAPNAKLYNPTIHVILVDESSLNAFSVIGNIIGINKGLLAQLTHVDEVYGILAHELAHIGQNHMIRSVNNRQEKTTLLIASIIAAVLLSSESGELSTALFLAGQGLFQRNTLAYSRDMEKEADRIGISMLRNSNINPNGMYDVFLKLQSNAIGFGDYSEYFRSHPLTINRLSDLKPRTLNQENIVTNPLRNQEFMWLKSGLFNTSDDPEQNKCLQQHTFQHCFAQQAEANPYNLLLQALIARGYIEEKQQQGVKILQKLLKFSPDNLMLKTELMLSFNKLNEHAKALEILQTLPDHRNPSFHKTAIAIAKNNDKHILQAKHEYLQFWHSGREKQAKAYQNHILRLNEFELAEKDQLRAFFKQYPTAN